MKKDLNTIAKLEQAIAKKYGDEAIRHPKADWTPEKEKEYQAQLAQLYEKEKTIDEKSEKIEIDGFLISQKLFIKDNNRVCPVCDTYSFETKDDVYMLKFNTCFKCYVQWVEGREDRWKSGWRPTKGLEK